MKAMSFPASSTERASGKPGRTSIDNPMKRILDDGPPGPADYGHDQQEDAPGDRGVRDTAPGRTPAGQADVEEQAGQVLPPMVFPGPLAFQPAPVMLPAPDAPGAIVSSAAPAGLSALVDALERKDFDRVQVLIKALGMEVAYVTLQPEDPPLVFAARLGHLGLVEALLAAGAEVNLANPKNGNTALAIAAREGHVEIVSLLLAQPDIECDKLNVHGGTALMGAAYRGHPGVVKCLLAAGAQVNHADSIEGHTPLIFAANNGYTDIVRLLLEQPGIECDKPDANGGCALTYAVCYNYFDVVDCLLTAGAEFDLADLLFSAAFGNHAGMVEILFRHGAQRSDLPADLSRQTAPFAVAIEDLAAEMNSSTPALPGPEQSREFFEELMDKLASREPGKDPMLRWLQGKGLRRAGAVELLAVLAGEQAPWKIPDASRQQKMLYCLGAISRLPALGGAGKVRKLYGDAGISAAAVERLGGAADDQLDHMASLAAAMLAGMGSEMLGALVDGCMARTNTGGEVNVAEFTASLIGQGYCPPVAQAIVRSWQDAMSAWGKLQMPASANGTAGQLMRMLKASMAEHAPALFAQTLLHALASREPVRQLNAMQENSHDEVLHALFQIQCDQLRQLCAQLLAPPPSGTPGASDGAGATQTGKLI